VAPPVTIDVPSNQGFTVVGSSTQAPIGLMSYSWFSSKLKNLLNVVIDNGRLSVLPEIASQFRQLVNDRGGVADAHIVSAFPLDDKQQADLAKVLTLEPRHFGAISGLGMILQEFGDEKRALDAFRKALAVNPHLDKVPELVKTLTEKVEGRDI